MRGTIKSCCFPLILSLHGILRILAQQREQIEPCFSAFPVTYIPPIASTACNQLYECLQSCLSNPICKSIVWDNTKNYCYHFSQTAHENPTILLNKFGTGYYEKTPTCGGSIMSRTTSAPVISGGCSNKQSTGYYVNTGSQLVDTNANTISYDREENQCITACTNQLNPVNNSPLSCSAINLNPKTKTCAISSTSGPPDGTGTLSANSDSVYVARFCLPATAPSSCFEQFFFMFPQKSLDGFNLNSAKATSLSACMGQCATTSGCKSVVYDSSTQDCTLKSSDAVSNPTALASASSSTYYVENGCLLRQQAAFKTALRTRLLSVKETEEPFLKRLSFSKWSAWSPCQHIMGSTRYRIRTRNCGNNLKKCPAKDIEKKICL